MFSSKLLDIVHRMTTYLVVFHKIRAMTYLYCSILL